MLSVGQEFWSCFTGCCWLGRGGVVSHDVTVIRGLEALLSRWLTYRAGSQSWLLVEASAPLHKPLPPWQLASPRGSGPSVGRKLQCHMT